MAEDDEDYYSLCQLAIEEAQLPCEFVRAEDGEVCLDYLYSRGGYASNPPAKRPDLILLDLNMPRLNGLETLQKLKSDPRLNSIPVLMMTISADPEDIRRCYQAGASSFITKPVNHDDLIRIFGLFKQYWFDVVTLPSS